MFKSIKNKINAAIVTSSLVNETKAIWNTEDMVETRRQMKEDFTQVGYNMSQRRTRAANESKRLIKKGGFVVTKLILSGVATVAKSTNNVTKENHKIKLICYK